MNYSVSNLTCARGLFSILDEVTFEIAAGEALIIRGPNGAGKTTLLRTIAGLSPTYDAVMNFTPDDVAYAAHADGLKAQLTVAENLTFWGQVYGADGIDAAVEAFDLAELLPRPTGYLSAGQKRRLSLSRLTLAGRPIWALDEPTVSLDAENVTRFAAAVETHLSSGGAAIIATHIDLGLTSARTLDIAQFAATHSAKSDPFLDRELS